MDDYDKHRAELETANLPLLHGFHQYLIDRRTGKRASCGHIDRLAFFANVYLLDYHEKTLADGYDEVSDYLGHWFIRKAMWSDVGALDENIETFRKFYAYLRSAGHIDEARFKELVETIEKGSPMWRRHARRYDDPEIDLEDVWDYGEDEELPPASSGLPVTAAAVPGAPSHLVLMLSGLAAKHFKIALPGLPKTDDLAAAGHWSACWRCDLLGSDTDSGTYYFILTNARTLYSLIVPVTDRKIESLVAFFVEILDHQYRLAGITPPPSPGATFRLVKGLPRSLIGSQNELIRCALHLFNRPDPSLDGLCHALNRTPMFAIPEVIPADAFAKAIASDPPFQAKTGTNILPFPGPSQN